jgi:hypothetical protein
MCPAGTSWSAQRHWRRVGAAGRLPQTPPPGCRTALGRRAVRPGLLPGCWVAGEQLQLAGSCSWRAAVASGQLQPAATFNSQPPSRACCLQVSMPLTAAATTCWLPASCPPPPWTHCAPFASRRWGCGWRSGCPWCAMAGPAQGPWTWRGSWPSRMCSSRWGCRPEGFLGPSRTCSSRLGGAVVCHSTAAHCSAARP